MPSSVVPFSCPPLGDPFMIYPFRLIGYSAAFGEAFYDRLPRDYTYTSYGVTVAYCLSHITFGGFTSYTRNEQILQRMLEIALFDGLATALIPMYIANGVRRLMKYLLRDVENEDVKSYAPGSLAVLSVLAAHRGLDFMWYQVVCKASSAIFGAGFVGRPVTCAPQIKAKPDCKKRKLLKEKVPKIQEPNISVKQKTWPPMKPTEEIPQKEAKSPKVNPSSVTLNVSDDGKIDVIISESGCELPIIRGPGGDLYTRDRSSPPAKPKVDDDRGWSDFKSQNKNYRERSRSPPSDKSKSADYRDRSVVKSQERWRREISSSPPGKPKAYDSRGRSGLISQDRNRPRNSASFDDFDSVIFTRHEPDQDQDYPNDGRRRDRSRGRFDRSIRTNHDDDIIRDFGRHGGHDRHVNESRRTLDDVIKHRDIRELSFSERNQRHPRARELHRNLPDDGLSPVKNVKKRRDISPQKPIKSGSKVSLIIYSGKVALNFEDGEEEQSEQTQLPKTPLHLPRKSQRVRPSDDVPPWR